MSSTIQESTLGENSTPERIEVLAPYAEAFERPEAQPLAPRLGAISGATVVVIENGFPASAIIARTLVDQFATLGAKARTIKKKYWEPMRNQDALDASAAADAVIGGLCTTPPSTIWTVKDCVGFEARGVPTVSLVAEFYTDLFTQTSALEGMPGLPNVTVPFPIDGLPSEIVSDIVLRRLPLIVQELANPA